VTEREVMNVVVLRGVIERAPEVRQLADGSELAVLDVRTELEVGRVTAPVVWVSEGHVLPEVGAEVVVTGHVRRRFFRAGGGTQSRTEVVADAVVPARSRARVRRAIDEALAGVFDPGGG
jgi:single-strand DNA-binding protein